MRTIFAVILLFICSARLSESTTSVGTCPGCLGVGERMRAAVSSFVAQEKLVDRGSEISVYFYDLSSRTDFGVNEQAEFAPASLMKVHIMMALYKMAESNGALLAKRLTIARENGTVYTQTMNGGAALQSGGSYPVESLIERMIVFSDNDAYTVLKKYLAAFNYEPLYHVYRHLGFPMHKFERDGDIMSPKLYAKTFIELYRASYLEGPMSERALKLLKASHFPYGLKAGLPREVEIAQKYGERGYAGSSVKQLHNCGIIYSPHRGPYVLCVMTKGTSWREQANAIKAISRRIFNEVNGN